MRNNGRPPNRLVSLLAVQKKKTITALCLIGVMVFMWARVLCRKTPGSAEAALTGQAINSAAGSDSELKISYTELPQVKGRNDVLSRDFFAANGWQGFVREGEGGTEEVSVVSRDGDEELARKVAEKLKLEAIGLGENPQAFINDKLLSVGDRLTVSDGVSTYECEVIEVEANKVLVRCEDAEITLKLSQDTSN